MPRASPQLAGATHLGSLLSATVPSALAKAEPAPAALRRPRVPVEVMRAPAPVAVSRDRSPLWSRDRSPEAEAELEQDPAKGSRSRDWAPFLQRDVPKEQQPAYELQELRRQSFQSWPEDDEYAQKLFNLYFAINFFVSLPVAFVTYNRLPAELAQLLLSANIGTLAAMVPFIFRLRVGWGFAS